MINNRRSRILRWHSAHLISTDNLKDALKTTDSDPIDSDWLHFLKHSFLWFGAIALSVGVIFFFAYNWQNISRFSKFVLLESIFLGATFVFFRQAKKYHIATVILTMLALLTGALLALVGQTYQTGADPWQLFAIWALFIVPWALISNTTSMWIIWMLLLNLSLLLYMNISASLWGMILSQGNSARLFVVLNSLMLIAFEWKYRYYEIKFGADNLKKSSNSRLKLVCQLLAILAGVAISTLTLDAIFSSKNASLNLIFYTAWMGAIYYYYRYQVRDLFIIASAALSVCTILISILVETIGSSFNEGAFLLVSFSIIGLSTTVGIWLKNLAKEFNRLDNPSNSNADDVKDTLQTRNTTSGGN